MSFIGRLLYCVKCGASVKHPLGGRDRCACGSTAFVSPSPDMWRLSSDDRQLLRNLKIART